MINFTPFHGTYIERPRDDEMAVKSIHLLQGWCLMRCISLTAFLHDLKTGEKIVDNDHLRFGCETRQQPWRTRYPVLVSFKPALRWRWKPIIRLLNASVSTCSVTHKKWIFHLRVVSWRPITDRLIPSIIPAAIATNRNQLQLGRCKSLRRKPRPYG